MKKFVILLFCLSLSNISTFAFATSEESSYGIEDEWFLNKPISSFKYNGLKNISQEKLKSKTQKYLKKPFTYDLFAKIQSDIYDMECFDSVLGEVDNDDKGDLIVILILTESPMLENILTEGDLGMSSSKFIKKLDIQTGKRANLLQAEGAAEIIQEALIADGYYSADVKFESQKNEEKNTYVYKYIVDHGPKGKVKDIKFNSATNEPLGLTYDVIYKAISTKKNSRSVAGSYVKKTIEEDVTRIEDLFKKNGYTDVSVSIDSIEDMDEDQKGESWRIVFKIDQGRKWIVGDVNVLGSKVISKEDLEKLLKVKKGKIYNTQYIQNDLDAISSKYYDLGYIFNTFDPQQIKNDESGTIDINYVVKEGKQAFITSLDVSGNDGTDKNVYLREIKFKVGDVFSRSSLVSSAQSLFNTGLLSDVNYDMQLNHEKEGGIDLTFLLKEARAKDMTFGLTFGGQAGSFPIQFTVGYSDKNFLGKGQTASTSISASSDYQTINFSWGTPWTGGIRWQNAFNFSFEHSYRDDMPQKNQDSNFLIGRNEAYPLGYNSYAQYLQYNQALPMSKYLMEYHMWRVAVGYTTGYTWIFDKGRLSFSGSVNFGLNHAVYDRTRYIPYELLIKKYGDGWKFSNNINIGIQWDGRDLITNTTKGYVISQGFTYAGGVLGGLSQYIKSNTTLQGFLTLINFQPNKLIKPRTLTASLSTRLGMVLPQWWNCSEDVARSKGWQWHDPKYGATRYEMLYIDGMTVARGFTSEYDFNFLWDTMLELSTPIIVDYINAEIFTSITALSKEFNVIDGRNMLGDLKWYGAFGFGAKIAIPGLPLGLYFVANYSIDQNGQFMWEEGSIFKYLKPVFAISTSLI